MDENSRRAVPWDARQVMYEALITSAIESARRAEAMGLDGNQIILSCKVSGVQDLISVYRELARRSDYALHLGLTEAGMGTKGTVASGRRAVRAAARGHRRHHPRVAHAPAGRSPHAGGGGRFRAAAGPGHAAYVPSVTACPGCGRTTSTTFQELAKQIDDHLRSQMPVWRVRYPASRSSRSRSWAASSTAPAKASMPTSASVCRHPARLRPRPCSSTAKRP